MPTNSKESEIRLASWILNDFRSHRRPRSSDSLDTNYNPLQNGLCVLPTPGVFSALSTFCFLLQPSSRMTEETVWYRAERGLGHLCGQARVSEAILQRSATPQPPSIEDPRLVQYMHLEQEGLQGISTQGSFRPKEGSVHVGKVRQTLCTVSEES